MERFSQRLVENDRLVDIDYHVVGHVQDTLHLEVSGVEELEKSATPKAVLKQFASELLGLEMLEARGSNSLDVRGLSVASIPAALLAACEAGRTKAATK